MIEQDGYTYFKTIGDLKQHIGDVILYSYMEKDKEVVYMKKLTKVYQDYYGENKLKDDDEIPESLITFGSYMVLLKSSYTSMETPRVHYLDFEGLSNRFDIIRMPTQEEMNIYRNTLRHARIFGMK